MDYAADKKAIDPATRATLLGNSLVVVAPKASAQGAITIDEKTDWTSLLKGRPSGGGRSTACPGRYPMPKRHCRNSVPREMLSPKLAPAEDVRGALALVERNEAPLGIVYGSDAVASKG
ncbi:molybdate ABC transporter substrate-binding protein [Klebsiella pneumoniae subsp. pneumoniae]|nr:molybdate ABC transporter substrate-binding protein [Klebsiella pneumoniae subsp. pneumoniae]